MRRVTKKAVIKAAIHWLEEGGGMIGCGDPNEFEFLREDNEEIIRGMKKLLKKIPSKLW